jgi:hypothetical protein
MSLLARLAAIAVAAAVVPALAQVAGGPQRAVNWGKAMEAVSTYRPVVDVSGLVEVDAQIPQGVDAEDLQALCEARGVAVRRARTAGEDELRSYGAGRDPITDARRAELERYLGAVSMFSGDVEAAIAHFERGRAALAPYLEDYPDLRGKANALAEVLGVAHLRRGEADNCLVNPGSDRCLFPLRPGGIHHAPAGAASAFEQFRALLVAEPDNLELRWLLNLSAMLTARYPDDVPAAFRVPPRALEADAPMPRFVDVARAAGLGRMSIAGGTVAEDFDGDGLVDVVLSSVDFCAPLRLYRNRGDGTFDERTAAARLEGQLGGLNATVTDVDNDGRPDLFVLRGGWEIAMRNSLLRANPDGTFTDVTRAAGLSSGRHATHHAAWADFDNDGWLDVFVGHELTPSQMFRNRGDGTFEDVTARAGVGATAFTKGIAAGDYDGDGWMDMYVSNMWGANFLYRNRGDGTFEERAAAAGVDGPFASFPTWFFDYDNDGRLDLFVSSYPPSVEEFAKHYVGRPPSAEPLALYRNLGGGRFENVAARTGLARAVPTMGSNFGDLDNDGFLDMYLGTGLPSFGALMPNLVLKNDEGRRFLDVTASTGMGHLQKGHGVAFADLDRDGDLDIVLNVGGAVPGDRYDDALFRNPGGHGNNWLSVRLVGEKTNRPAVGATIAARLPGGALRFREVTTGGSFGASPFAQHLGLGRAAAVETLTITWPTSRSTQTFRNVPANQAIEIREFAQDYRVVERAAFEIGRPSAPAATEPVRRP